MVMNEWHELLWCECDDEVPIIREGMVYCQNCNAPTSCEFCGVNNIATVIHGDYAVCKDHEQDAIDNVENRRW
jgi:hypothetical protein